MSEKMNPLARFFHGFEFSAAKLELFRIVFFGIFALDAFLQIPHAPRYGAGDFNVAHFEWLSTLLPMPSRHLMLAVFLLQAFLAFRIMAGVAIRQSLALLTALFGYGYFISQVNSYQHHYLLFLLLFLLNFCPWDAARRSENPKELMPGWSIRTLLVQFSILYFWTAVAKMDGHWLSGETLAMQVPDSGTRDMVANVAQSLGVETLTLWAAASIGVMVMEVILAIGLQFPKLWPFMMPIGMAFHASVEFSGYKIGLFSYFMVLAYILVIPESWMDKPAKFFSNQNAEAEPEATGKKKKKKKQAPKPQPVGVLGGTTELAIAGFCGLLLIGLVGAAEKLAPIHMVVTMLVGIILLMMALQYFPGSWLARFEKHYFAKSNAQMQWGIIGGALVLGAALIYTMPFEEALVLALLVTVMGVIPELMNREGHARRAMAHLLACGLIVALTHSGEEARDYYRFMGGDARRRGDVQTATLAYQKVTEVAPTYSYGFRRLGDLHMRSRDYDAAIAAYEEAVRLNDQEALFTYKLMVAYDRAGKGALAVESAQDLLKLKIKKESRDQAQRIIAKYGKGLP